MHCGSVANISCYNLHIIGLVNYLTRSILPSGDLRCSYAVWLATHRALPLPCVSLRLGLALYFNNSSIACQIKWNSYTCIIREDPFIFDQSSMVFQSLEGKTNFYLASYVFKIKEERYNTRSMYLTMVGMLL